MTHDATNAQAWLPELTGKFIVFEGPDGSGKSTQYARFVKLCQQVGVPIAEVREPGGTALGERIREILLDPQYNEMSLRCEMLLYMASRAQLVNEMIRPALDEGKLVVADRFVQSTIAYQGAAGGLSHQEIKAVAKVVLQEVVPDLVIIFDVDEATAASRMNGNRDRIESRDTAYRERVRQGYLELASDDPARHVVIDGSREPAEVEADVLEALGRTLVPTE